MNGKITVTDLAGKILSSECFYLEGEYVRATVFSDKDVERLEKGEDLALFIGETFCKIRKSK